MDISVKIVIITVKIGVVFVIFSVVIGIIFAFNVVLIIVLIIAIKVTLDKCIFKG